MEALLNPLIEKLTDLLIEEVKFLKEVPGEIESLKKELEMIQPLLKDAQVKSEKGEMSGAVKAWVSELRLQADRIEDVVDNYLYHLTALHNKKGLARFVKPLITYHKIAAEIVNVKQSLNGIGARGKKYGLRPLDQAGPSQGVPIEERVDPRLESLFLEEKDVVGIKSVKDEVIGKLVEDPSEFLVMSLVGQGGVGKTTLAKKVFDARAVMRRFKSARAWVTVSQPYNTKKILETLAEKLCVARRGEGNTVEDLIGRLKSHLRTKRYLIVFDDVWEESFWDEIKLALLPNNVGSRIVITTRNSSIADRCKNSPRDLVRHITPLSQKPALELFVKEAFRNEFQGGCPDELLQSSTQIVSKCQGLPLVIVAIAGILATKEKTISEWERVLRDLDTKVGMSSELSRVHKILSLSYDDLPHSLRPGFTYICVFPEEYSIADERLYRLWTAEGFVKAKGDKTAEEVAEEYLSKLFRRNLVSLGPFNLIGDGNFFRVHTFMRDVSLARAEDMSFYKIWDAKASKFIGNGRRVVISGDVKKALENLETSWARTLLLSNTSDDQLTESFLASLFEKFKLLEVLDFESSRIETLPKELGKMLFLKYLSLRKTNVKSLPKSISKLQKLYSLDIRETLISELPKEINELRNLQHILAYRYNQNHKAIFDYIIGVRLRKGFGGNLKGLQTLTAVDAHRCGAALMRELENLEWLRWLDVVGLTAKLSHALFPVIGKLKRLERLCLASVSEAEPLSLQQLSSPPDGLRELSLTGQLERLLGWISELRNLQGLVLMSSRLTKEAVDAFKGLPNLERLELGEDSYEGEELRFEEVGFSRLKSLMIYKLRNLRAVKIEKGALLVLERLEIHECQVLQEVPSAEHLRNLKYAAVNGKLII